ncbi:PH domain-containing protein [Friedmanniella luteola]|uniref:PH domain-containing protein n=1 Tax=Friedmanniella luteola TaxID=546871 RepID=A0A1H1XSG0_9ACTN|nr:PH domain-containing protein [Friedmanniella luteola]SDT12092.1 PH domain-containing protein [Friedmanniella luteola]
MSSTPSAAPEPVAWRLGGPPLLLRLAPLAAVVWIAVGGLRRLSDPARARDGSDALLVIGYLVLLLAVVAAGVVTARTRVRVDDEGVEVREIGTHRYPWAQITGVRVDTAQPPRWAALELADGRRRALPAPGGALRRRGDTTVTDAADLLRRRRERYRPPSG